MAALLPFPGRQAGSLREADAGGASGTFPGDVSALCEWGGDPPARTCRGWHPKNREDTGGFLDISMSTTPMDMAQGIYEGIGCETRVILELLEEAGIGTGRIICAGGGTRNRLLMQAKADVTGHTFLISRRTQATALGAAAIAGGIRFKRAMEAGRVYPEEKYRKIYDTKYATYQRLLL